MKNDLLVYHGGGLRPKQWQAVRRILSHFPQVTRVILFGSRAKGNFKPASDVDLWLEGNVDFTQLTRISLALEELWWPLKFDLILARYVKNEALRAHVHRAGKLILANTKPN